MEKAGWAWADGYRYKKDGEKCVVTIYYNSTTHRNGPSANMQNDLKKIGVELRIVGEKAGVSGSAAHRRIRPAILCRGVHRMIRSRICLLGAFHGDYQAQVGLEH